MSFNVRVRRAAEADIREAEGWYNEQRHGLGAEFRAEVFSILHRLEQTPFIYVQAYRNVRRAPVHRFPYLVWYRIRGNSIQVLGCSHSRQHHAAMFQRFQ
ncbi:MAG: type II toxin-antitoxin system RelE/ParE family toxin [Panacagrimonas sp.]